MEDQRLNLQALPDEIVFNIARNESAQQRELALRILVERGSLYAGRDEVADKARQLIIDNPVVLKKVDPASGIHALKLPGVIDILADLQTRRVALTRLVDEHNTVHIENHAAHTQTIEALKGIVNENKSAGDLAVREAYATLWSYFAKQQWQLMQEYTEQRLDFEQQLQTLKADHQQDITAASKRLRLLERSAWQKFVDYLKIVKRSWIDGRKLPLTDPPANPPLSA